MARPPDPEKRRDIARRAVEILAREGLTISIAQLATQLDLKRPTLLYHFPSIAHIVEVALEDLLTEQATFVLSEIARHDHPLDRIYAQVKAVHAFHHGAEQRIVFLTQAIASVGRERTAAILEVGHRVFEEHRRAAADRVRKGIDEGTVAPCDPDAIVALARAMQDGLLVQRVMNGVELAPVHEAFWQHVLAPLKRTPKPARRRASRANPTRLRATSKTVTP